MDWMSVAGQMGSPIVFGQLPYISTNSVGNPSSVKKTCFGFFNNTLGADTYCPKAGGVFIRFYNAESDPVNSTLYFVFKYVADLNGLYVIQDGGILMKIAEV